MALTKEIVEDKIEVVGDHKILQIRQATVIKEDGKVLSKSFHRRCLAPGDVNDKEVWTDTDVSSESAEVKGIANTVWTQSVKDKYKAYLIAEDKRIADPSA